MSKVVHGDLAMYLYCHDQKTYGAQYLRRCESRRYGKAISNNIMKLHGLTWSQKDDFTCDMDGSFAPVNCKEEQNKCGCVDKFNNWMQNYNDANNLQDLFNCQCARDRLINPNIGLTCDKRGNYEAIQSFKNPAPGNEYCVDQDGFQITPKYTILGGTSGKKCKIPFCQARIDECTDDEENDNEQCETCSSTCY